VSAACVGSSERRQQSLFVDPPAEPTRFEQWQEFHRANPEIYRQFLDRTLAAHLYGRKVGARCIWESIRWHLNVEVAGVAGDEYAMNDHHVPYYARLVMLRHPPLEGFFDRRDKHFDTDDATLLRAADRIDHDRGKTR
jgi:hypothetical protein